MNRFFSFVGNYEKAIANSTSLTQLETSIVSVAGTSQVERDNLFVSNYVTAQCGTGGHELVLRRSRYFVGPADPRSSSVGVASR